jgi:hypothetical protein
MIMAHEFTHNLVLLGVCALLGLSACGSEAPTGALPGEAAATSEATPEQVPNAEAPADSVAVEGRSGSIELSLTLGGKQLASLNYAIVGAGYAKSGSFDVSHSSKVSGIVGGIPFGNDYALTMTGQGVGEAPLDCSGSTSFDLSAVGPLPVAIKITCKEPDVSEPPPTPTPAPVPPFAVITLACLLAALGVATQRRAARG